MPRWMSEVLSDRLRLVAGGEKKEFLHSVMFDTTGLLGTPDEVMRQIEDRERPILQRAIEEVIPLNSIVAGDPAKTDPVWPEKIEGSDLISRADTVGIRVISLSPLEYKIALGDARVMPTLPKNWWESEVYT